MLQWRMTLFLSSGTRLARVTRSPVPSRVLLAEPSKGMFPCHPEAPATPSAALPAAVPALQHSLEHVGARVLAAGVQSRRGSELLALQLWSPH